MIPREPVPSRAALEHTWRTLEASACPSFFIAALDRLAACGCARGEPPETAALVLHGSAYAPPRGLIPARGPYINETVAPLFDAIMIEHHGIMAPSGSEAAVRLSEAATATEALAFFAELKTLHCESWERRGKPHAFAGSFFDPFHRLLLTRSVADGRASSCGSLPATVYSAISAIFAWATPRGLPERVRRRGPTRTPRNDRAHARAFRLEHFARCLRARIDHRNSPFAAIYACVTIGRKWKLRIP